LLSWRGMRIDLSEWKAELIRRAEYRTGVAQRLVPAKIVWERDLLPIPWWMYKGDHDEK